MKKNHAKSTKIKVGDTVYYFDRNCQCVRSAKIKIVCGVAEDFFYIRPTGMKYSIAIRKSRVSKDYEEICNGLCSFVTENIEEQKRYLHGLYKTLKQVRRFKARHDKIKERNK